MFYAANHVTHNVRPGKPWEPGALQIPDEVRGIEGKPARDKWLSDRSTKHNVFTVFEGLNSSQRITQAGGSAELCNLPMFMHGAVADLDFPFRPDDLQKELEKLKFAPNWVERTLSGNWLLLWVFEEKLALPPVYKTARDIAKAVAVGLGMPQLREFDVKSYEPTQRFVNSGEWFPMTDDAGAPMPPMSAGVVRGWAAAAMSKLECCDDGSEDIPIEIVLAAMEKKYPEGMQSWPGEFLIESMGPTFWIPASKSTKSAIVKPNGMFTFSESAAPKTFWSWGDLLGKAFVEENTAGRKGKILSTVFKDPTCFLKQDQGGIWRTYSSDELARNLKARGFSSCIGKGDTISDVDGLINDITEQNRVEVAGPYAFMPPGIMWDDGRRCLNTFNRKLCSIHSEPVSWGQGFPLIAGLTEWLFDPEQIRILCSWFHWALAGYVAQRPESGQILILAGAPGMGKTCWTNEVVGGLFGGTADASRFMIGEDSFGGELYDVAVWTLEDTSMSTTPEDRERMTRNLKQYAANTKHRVHNKYRAPSYPKWAGRIVSTMNDDPQSLQGSPALDTAIMDKLIFLHVRQTEMFDWPGRHDASEQFKRELPYFARYILDFQIPEDLVGTKRYGVKAHIDKSLEARLINSSTSSGLCEVLLRWAMEYFDENPDATEWIGTATELSIDVARDEVLTRVVKIDAKTMARFLPHIAPHLSFLHLHSDGDGVTTSRTWRVTRPPGFVPKKKKAPPTATA